MSSSAYSSCVRKARKTVSSLVPQVKCLLGIRLDGNPNNGHGPLQFVLAIGHNGSQKHPSCAYFEAGTDWAHLSGTSPTIIDLPVLSNTPDKPWYKNTAREIANRTLGPNGVILWSFEERQTLPLFPSRWDLRERRGSVRRHRA